MFGKTKSDSVTGKPAEEAAPAEETPKSEPPRGNANPVDSGFLLDRNKPSIISEGFSLHGNITAQGVLHVEGFIKGTVQTDVVNIGPTGALEGQIACKTLQIKGSFTGTARCEELVIAKKARVVGRVSYRTLTVQRGALVEGELFREG